MLAGGIGWACVTMLSGAARRGLRDDAGGRHRRGDDVLKSIDDGSSSLPLVRAGTPEPYSKS